MIEGRYVIGLAWISRSCGGRRQTSNAWEFNGRERSPATHGGKLEGRDKDDTWETKNVSAEHLLFFLIYIYIYIPLFLRVCLY